jgi:hypothetical protein
MRTILLTTLTAAALLSPAMLGSQAQAITVAVPSAANDTGLVQKAAVVWAIAAASEPIIATMGIIDRTATAIAAGTDNLLQAYWYPKQQSRRSWIKPAALPCPHAAFLDGYLSLDVCPDQARNAASACLRSSALLS